MSVPISDPLLEKAASQIGLKPIIDLDGRELHVVGIFSWSPPLIARWWRGKAVTIVGVDVDGNFFLRHSDGSVRFWEHSKKAETTVAKSVREFCSKLREDSNDSLSWWKSRGSADAT
jgi:hypothetical protein